jgi:inorganic phosphate transporter, PiT family
LTTYSSGLASPLDEYAQWRLTSLVDAALFILIVVVVIALAFDFTNGFHDTANAMATSIATGALKPRIAVLLSACLNLIGAFLSIQVALTVTNKVINIQTENGQPNESLMGVPILVILFAGLCGAIIWNLITWLFGLPSSSTHALFGGLVGATIAALGWGGVKWDGIITAVVLPAVFAPVIAALVSGIGTRIIYAITSKTPKEPRDKGFRWGQVGSASLVSLAHGTGDAQKTMGVITLALFAYGAWTSTESIPTWVKIACALSIAAGTYVGGWRVIRTLGKGLVDIESPQGMAAESASAVAILTSSHLGLALSTTQVCTGSIFGTGLGKKGATVRWGVAGRMVVAWVITLPSAALMGAACWAIAHAIGPVWGTVIVLALLIATAGFIYLRSRRNAINPENVNAEWQGGLTPAEETPAAPSTPARA